MSFQSKCIRISVRAQNLKKSKSVLVVSDTTTDGKWEEKSRSEQARSSDPEFENRTDIWTRGVDRMIEFKFLNSGKAFAVATIHLSDILSGPNRRFERLLDDAHSGMRLHKSKIMVMWIPGPEVAPAPVQMKMIQPSVNVQVVSQGSQMYSPPQMFMPPMMRPQMSFVGMPNQMGGGMMQQQSSRNLAPSGGPGGGPPAYPQGPPAYSESPPAYTSGEDPSPLASPQSGAIAQVTCYNCRVACCVPPKLQFMCPTCGAGLCLPGFQPPAFAAPLQPQQSFVAPLQSQQSFVASGVEG